MSFSTSSSFPPLLLIFWKADRFHSCGWRKPGLLFLDSKAEEEEEAAARNKTAEVAKEELDRVRRRMVKHKD